MGRQEQDYVRSAVERYIPEKRHSTAKEDSLASAIYVLAIALLDHVKDPNVTPEMTEQLILEVLELLTW